MLNHLCSFIIGQAFPAVSYLMTDQSDNTTRMYPQALLKQYTKLDAQPDWSSFDINAQFNSDIDWYFEVLYSFPPYSI